MARGPGPQQVFNQKIIRISFPTVGGLVLFRVAQRYDGDTPATPAPVASVVGLPWGTFDMFAVAGQNQIDPEGTPTDQVPIANPVTDDMLTKYLYWAHWPKARGVKSQTLPGFEIVVVDLAQWTLIYNHHTTSRLSSIMSREAALAQFRGLVGSTGYEGLDPDLMGVALTNNLGQDFATTEALIEYANAAGWTYHVETAPGASVNTVDDVAIVIINLAKLFRDVPNVNGKKPPSITFTINPPVRTFADGVGGLNWSISASAWIPKLLNPPKPNDPVADSRRIDFPVEDIQVPISGIPGAFNTDYHMPTFTHPDEFADVALIGLNRNEVVPVTCTITFGAGNVAPEVELSAEFGGGEVG